MKGSVNLSGGSVSINATSKLLVQKNKSSYISLENEFYVKASAVYENGSARESNPAFTDDEPTAGVAQALAKRKKESLAFNNGNLLLAMLGSKTTLAQTSTLNGSIMLTNPGESYIVPATIPEYNPYGNYEHGDKVERQAKNGEYFSGEVFYLNQNRTFIPDNAEGYEKANKGEFTKSVQTALCAGGDVAAEVGYDILKGACSAESWIASKVWKDDSAAQYWNEAKENLNKDEQYAHKFYKENALYAADFKDYRATIGGAVEILNIIWACEGGIALAKGASTLVKGGINFLKSEKVASSVSKVIDDLGEWTKNIFRKKSISEAKTAETGNAALKDADVVAGKADNVITEADRIKQFNLNNCRGQMKDSLSKFRERLANDKDARGISKICSTADLGNLNLKGEAGSGIWKYNPTIKDYTGVDPREFCKTTEDYTKYYRSLLSDEYLGSLPDNFWVGKNKEFIKEDMAKLRADIEKVKREAADEGEFNAHGEPSFEYQWNVDNCAEIWSSRDAILKGARYDNLVYRTENLYGGFAEPCENCQRTFKGTYNIDN